MSNPNPSPETRFPVNRPDAPFAGHTGPRLTTILKKLLSAEWEVNDPKVQALIEKCGLDRTIEVILCLRRVLNGTEGDDQAIERIFDRIDGKVPGTPAIEINTYTQVWNSALQKTKAVDERGRVTRIEA